MLLKLQIHMDISFFFLEWIITVKLILTSNLLSSRNLFVKYVFPDTYSICVRDFGSSFYRIKWILNWLADEHQSSYFIEHHV